MVLKILPHILQSIVFLSRLVAMKTHLRNMRRAKFYKTEPFKSQVHLKQISTEISITEDNQGCETFLFAKTVFLA